MRLLTLFVFISCHSNCAGQTLLPLVLGELPFRVNESSGLEQDESGTFWTHNDGGGGAYVYRINAQGKEMCRVRLEGARQIDWEDITIGRNETLYIGDIGNNDNNRKDLRIYVFPIPVNCQGTTQIKPTVIHFRYEDQSQFPPPDKQKNFDAEAVAWHKDSLYIFTKNRTVPFNGICSWYVIPAKPGNYIARKIGQIELPGNDLEARVTGADIKKDGSQLVLLTNQKAYVYDVSGKIRPRKPSQILTWKDTTQKEGICWDEQQPCSLFLTDENEGKNKVRGKLYQVQYCVPKN